MKMPAPFESSHAGLAVASISRCMRASSGGPKAALVSDSDTSRMKFRFMAVPFRVESFGDSHSARIVGGHPHSSTRAFGRFARAVSLPGVGVSFADALFHALNCSGLH